MPAAWRKVATLMSVAASLAGEAAADETQYLAAYRCSVVERLMAIHRVQPREMHRFMILGVPHIENGYVQCLMLEDDTRVLCEASSGFWLGPEGEPPRSILAPDRVEALGALGFSTDGSESNYQKMIDIKDGDFTPVADLMLLALYHGYDVRAPAETVTVDAPLIDEENGRLQSCGPSATDPAGLVS